MKRPIAIVAACALAFAMACSKDEAEKAAGEMEKAGSEAAASAGAAAERAANAARESAASATNAARDAAAGAAASAKQAGAAVAASAVDTCRSMAEAGAWGSALEACRKAHEMLPDDLAIEHAYQQAKAAAGQ